MLKSKTKARGFRSDQVFKSFYPKKKKRKEVEFLAAEKKCSWFLEEHIDS